MRADKAVKIIFWGTAEFALPSLEALLKAGYDIAAVVANPDEPAGRKLVMTPPPVKVFAEKKGIPVLQPISLKEAEFKKELPEADIFIVAAYGKIIPAELLKIPPLGALNVHPSLLPRWRGPSPVQFTILSGDAETGATIMKVDELMDHGPIAAKAKLEKRISGLYYSELCAELAKLGAELLLNVLPRHIKGEIVPEPQDDSAATYAKILKKDDGRIDWKKPAEEIERAVRAFNFWPGAWTILPSDGKIYRVIIKEAGWLKETPSEGSAGYAWQRKPNELLVKTGKGSLLIKKVVFAGKKSGEISAFLRGYPLLGKTFI